MIRTVKAKTARGARELEKREPKVHEEGKLAFFVRGSTASSAGLGLLKDMYLLRKPDGVSFTRKNEYRPFEDASPFESQSRKIDASLFAFVSHSKKRPHNLVLGRCFNHTILDMQELGVENYKAISEFKQNLQKSEGSKPCILFNGEPWSQSPRLGRLKSLLLDFFRGKVVEAVNLAGLDHVISFSITGGLSVDTVNQGQGPEFTVNMRVYAIKLLKSGTRLPRVELEEIGPHADFTLRREKEAEAQTLKEAMRIPKEAKAAKVKNVSTTAMGDRLGRIHLGKQDFESIQTRKIKGLKKRERTEENVTGSGEAQSEGEGSKRRSKKSRTSNEF